MRLLWLILFCAAPASAWAAEPPSLAGAALQTGCALLVVIGLILGLYALARKRLLLGKIGGKAITVVEMRPLAPKSTLALVEVRGREYLLGLSPAGIQLLAEVSANAGPAKPEFAALLAETK